MATGIGVTRLDRLREGGQHHGEGLRAPFALSLFRIRAA
jgi:hypothetical protein